MTSRAEALEHRLKEAAKQACQLQTAALAIDDVKEPIVLICRYMGVADCDGQLTVDKPPTTRSKVLFNWSIEATCEGSARCCTVAVLCCHALSPQRGIPFPQVWRLLLRCSTFPAMADAAVRAFAENTCLEGLSCLVLGVPRRAALPVLDAVVPTIGAGVRLQSSAASPVEEIWLLCAQIAGTSWLCLNADMPVCLPLQGQELVVRDVGLQHLLHEDDELRAKKRKTMSIDSSGFWKVVSEKPGEWSSLVAYATFKAEVLRAEWERRQPNVAAAVEGFESNPWLWSIPADPTTHISVLWYGREAEQIRCEMLQASLEVILKQKRLPTPATVSEDACLYDRLIEKAVQEERLRKAPCKYLGLACGGGCFEPNPGRWPLQVCSQGRKTHADVTFEWSGVSRGTAPHHVTVSVNNLLRQEGRPVPHHPLGNPAPSMLTFSLEFLAVVACNVMPGIVFKGVAYDDERPEIEVILPKGGLDIQDEPLYWALPDGSVVCWSLRQLVSARPDELAPRDSDEAYSGVATRAC
jgi:hypothetical protein